MSKTKEQKVIEHINKEISLRQHAIRLSRKRRYKKMEELDHAGGVIIDTYASIARQARIEIELNLSAIETLEKALSCTNSWIPGLSGSDVFKGGFDPKDGFAYQRRNSEQANET